MNRRLASFLAVAFVSVLPAAASGQIVINEIHAQGTTASPALQGDVVELWNQGSTAVDISGYTLGMWAGDGTPTAPPVLTNKVIPVSLNGDHIIYGNCFLILEEGGVSGASLSDPASAMSLKLDGLQGVPFGNPSTVVGGAYIGLSPGQSGGASDQGPMAYTLGYVYGPPATGLVYMYGIPNTIFAGLTSITFLPQTGVNNYDALVQ